MSTSTAINLETSADIESLIARIVSETPENIPVVIKQTAKAVMDALEEQYGPDSSNVRTLLSFEKLTDKVRAHCRSRFDLDKTVDHQIVMSEFGEDIQPRYPVKVKDMAGGKDTEYQSPLYAPREQLEGHIKTMSKRGKTYLRRAEALKAFVDQYR